MTTLSLVIKATLILAGGLSAVWLARRSRASVRHLMLALSFGMLLLLPAATLISPTVGVAVPSSVEGVLEPLDLQPIAAIEEMPVPASVAVLPALRPGWKWPSRDELLLAVWLIGVTLFLMPVIVGLRQAGLLRRTGIPWRAGQEMTDDLAGRAGIRAGRVELLLTDSVPGPMTCGVLRPAILLPAEATGWSADDLSRAVVHELEHVRRHDWLTQCLTRIVAAAYWFHPLIWVAWRRFSLEAERACDDAVLSSRSRSDDTAYADQLVHLAQRLRASSTQIHLAMANRRDLSSRITAVLDQGQPRGRAGQASVLVAGTVAAGALLIISPLQIALNSQARQASAETTQRFDVASIKPCINREDLQPGRARGTAGGTNASASPGRLTVPCVTLEQLIYLAHASYGAREDERLENDYMGGPSDSTKVRGGPDWVHSHKEKWAIEATAPGVTDRYVLLGTMLRNLLAERFRLSIHRETETLPMYALRVAKSGIKMKPMSDEECERRRSEERAGKDVEPCGRMLRSSGSISRVHLVGFQMGSIARMIADETGVHVIDETNVTGRFLVDLNYVSSDFAIKAASEPGAAASLPGGGATLFTALEEQLGLEVEKTTGRKGYIVVDRAEKPVPDSGFVSQADAAARSQRYDAATVRKCEAEPEPTGARGTFGGTNAEVTPGRFYVPCVTTEQLIYLAYAGPGVREEDRLVNDDAGAGSSASKVRGGPDWVHSLREKYRIEATAAGVTERTVLMGSMLRALLEDRFRLRLHRETEEAPMLKLVVAKSGLKVKPIRDGECNPDYSGPPDPAAKPNCGAMTMQNQDGLTSWTFAGLPMSQLAYSLAGPAGAHVIDETGLKEKYLMKLEFVRRNGPTGSATVNGPDIFTALQEQLGLRLEAARGPRGYLVIDSISRPTADSPAPARAASPGRLR